MRENTAADIKHLRKLADGLHEHARACKKPLSDCVRCAMNIEWFRALPPQTLSLVLAEGK